MPSYIYIGLTMPNAVLDKVGTPRGKHIGGTLYKTGRLRFNSGVISVELKRTLNSIHERDERRHDRL